MVGVNVQEALLQRRIDPALTNRNLTELCRRGGAGTAEVRGYRTLTGGCWNRVISVRSGDRDFVLKISPQAHDERIIREHAVLREFATQTDLLVPVPLYLDRESEVLPGTTLVMTKLPGAVMHECFGLLNYGARRRITDQIAEDLAELHRIRAHGFGGVELTAEERDDEWPDFWLPRFDRVIDEAAASGSIPARLIDGAREIRPDLRPHLEIGSSSTLTHYDIWSGNVMVDVEADPPRVSGYIDIPGFYADYARELSFAMLFGIAGRRFFETYLRYHDLDDGFEMRANIYNLKMNIKHIQMYPSQTVYQEGAAANLDFVRSHG